MLEIIKAIVATITAVLGTYELIYKKVVKKELDKKVKYYNEILKPFIKEYRKNTNIDSIEYIRKHEEKLEVDEVPRYILYVLYENAEQNENAEQKMKNVLLYDYLEIYDNERGKIRRITKGINRLLMYILFFILLAFLILFSMLIATILLDFLNGNFNGIIIEALIAFVCIMVAFLLNLGIYVINEDDYTLNIKKMKKLTKKKNDFMTKHAKEYYL